MHEKSARKIAYASFFARLLKQIAQRLKQQCKIFKEIAYNIFLHPLNEIIRKYYAETLFSHRCPAVPGYRNGGCSKGRRKDQFPVLVDCNS